MGNQSMRLRHRAKPMTRGIHHLALNTDDMKMRTQDEALAELASLSEDRAWLEQVTRQLPTRRPAA